MFKPKLLLPAVAFALLLGVLGCADDLQEQPFSSITEESLNIESGDYQSAIGPVYSNMRDLMGFYNYFVQEITTDEMVQPANASGWDDGGIYARMHQHEWNAEQPHIGSLWGTLYQGVIHSNRILGQIEKGVIKLPEGVSKEAARSEIRTARAFYYWLLMDNFGSVPLVTKPSGETEGLPSKTPRSEIYNFVVSELQSAIPNLGESAGPEMYGRFNKWAAKALLAAVYLNAEVYTGSAQWQKVIAQTNDVINSGRYALEGDYSAPFSAQNQDSDEIVFSIPYDEVNGSGFFLFQISHHASVKAKYQTQVTPWGAGSAKAVPQFGSMYAPEDKRQEKTWVSGVQTKPNGDTLTGQYDNIGEPLDYSRKMEDGIYTSEDAGWRIGKFEIEKGAQSTLNNDFPFFRYARVLMMKAEALLRTGSPGQAADIVTRVRERAFGDPNDAQVSASDLKKDSRYDYGYWEDFEIVDEGNTDPIQYGWFLDELGREFAAEMYRRRDVIRFGAYTKKSWLSHRPNGDYRTVFPIPQGVVQSNPNLKQNSNY